MTEIIHDGMRLVPSRESARRFNITNDYIGRLCKQGKVSGSLISGSWYVNEESLRDFLLKTNREKYERREALREQRAHAYREAQARLLGDAIPAKRAVVAEKKVAPLPPRPLRIHATPRRVPKTFTIFAQRGLAVMIAVIVIVGGLRFSDASVFQVAREVLPAAAAISGRNDVFANASQSAIAKFLGANRDNESYWIWYETSGETYDQPEMSSGIAEKPSVIERIVDAVTQSSISEALLNARLAAMESRLMALISLVPPTNSVAPVYHYYIDNSSGIGGSGFDDIDITNSTYTGGTITGATITGGSVTATEFDGVLPVENGGTGTSTYAVGDILYADSPSTLGRLAQGTNGQVLKVVGGNLVWSQDIAGGGGSGAFATTSDDLAIYVADPSDVVIIGSNATSTTGNILEIAGNTLMRGALAAYNTITAPIFTATSTTATSTMPRLNITGSLGIGSDYITDISGDGLSVQSGALALDRTGDWTGTFDGLEGSYYLANSFSTTSASYFISQQNLSGFSTTSADYWKTQRDFFATTSVEYWKSVSNFFSTTSAAYFLSQNQEEAFSTTSAAYFLSQQNVSGFSTTSADFWQTQRNFFSTTSTDYWKSVNNFFSTTSADFWKTANNFFSTSSAQYFVNSSTTIPKMYTANTFTALQSFGNASSSILSANTFCLSNDCRTSWPSAGSSFAYPFPNDATSTLLTFNGGINVPGQQIRLLDSFWYIQEASNYNLAGNDHGVRFGAHGGSAGRSWTFYDTNASAARAAINIADGSSYFSGNMGIGTTTPSTKLFVVGDVTGARFIATTSSASVFPYASTTALSATTLCLGSDCRTSWPTDSEFSTTSADFWQTQRNFFSTTSAAYFSSVGLAFSTTSNDYWASIRNFFSTTSASYFLSQNQGAAFSSTSANYFIHSSTTVPKLYTSNTWTGGNIFGNATTSYATTTNLFVTDTFAGAGLGACNASGDKLVYNANTKQFECGSDAGAGGGITSLRAQYSSSQTGSAQVFATSSDTNLQLTITSSGDTHTFTPVWSGVLAVGRGGTGLASAPSYGQVLVGDGLGGYMLTATSSLGLSSSSFSTTSADYWQTQRNFFSTTSAQYFAHSSTTIAKTYTANTFTALQNFANASSTLFSASYASTTNLFANTASTSNLTISALQNGLLKVNASGVVSLAVAGTDYQNFAYPFGLTGNATSTLTQFNGGLTAYASSTIGNGTSAGGLTINGRATTTGSAYIAGTLGVGTFSNLNGAITANGTFGVQSEGDIFRQYDSGDATWYPIIARYNTANGSYPASTYIFGNGANAKVAFEVPGGGNLTTFQVRANTATFNGALTAGNATTTQLGISGIPSALLATDANGTVYATTSISSSLLDTSGNWTGTFDGQEGSYYLANSFSTTSANYWQTTRDFFSTTSAIYFAHSSTTIPKTYTNNTFTGTNVFNAITLGALNGPLQANNGVISATSSILAIYGGTGQTTYSVGDILYADSTGSLARLPVGGSGTVLKIAGGVPVWGTDITSGGGGGATAFSTTSDSLAIYPTDSTDVFILGSNATVTANSILEVFGRSYFSQNVGIGTTSPGSMLAVSGNILANRITGANFVATSTTASVFPYASTTALSATTLCLSADCRTSWPTDSEFSTTSADYWKTQRDFFSTTSASYFSSIGLAWSTTSANYYLSQNGSLGFSTTSNDYWMSQRNFFSTTSANYWSSLGLGFSTSSADAWKDQRNFFSTTSAAYFLSQNQGNAFSTTSANYFVSSSTTLPKTYTANTFTALQTFTNASSTLFSSAYASSTFANIGTLNLGAALTVSNGGTGSTTLTGILKGNGTGAIQTAIPGVDYLNSTSGDWTGTFDGQEGSYYLANSFSTTSANYWQTTRNFFSTTSADYWETQQTARTADDLSNNSIEDLSDVAAMTENYGDLLGWNGSTWIDFATSSLGIAIGDTTGTLSVSRGGTGATSFTSGSLIYGSGTGALQSVATTTATIGGSLSYTGTFGALVGGASGTLSLNLGNANTWSALQQFGAGASSTALSAYNTLSVGRTSTTTIRGDNQASTLPYASTTAITATTASTTNLVISGLNSGLLRVNASGVVSLATLGTDYQNFAYPFGLTGNATSTLTQFNGGLTAYASSTIGSGAAAGGLTISGNSTTTGSAYIANDLRMTNAANVYFGTDNNTFLRGNSGGGYISLGTTGTFQFLMKTDGSFGLGGTAVGFSGYDGASIMGTANGNIGVGTTSPYSKFTTWGSGQLFEAVNNSSTTIFRIGQTGATTTGFAITGLPSALLATDASGNVYATTSISSGLLNTSGNWTGTFDGQEGSYYLANSFSTTSANYFVHSSTTIPKTYTSNTWTGLSTFNGNVVMNGFFTLGSINGPLHTNNGVVSATTSIGVLYGGTGLTSAPTYGQLLLGNASGGYTLTATSSLGLPTFAYPFPAGATTTALSFGNITATNATTSTLFSGVVSGNALAIGGTGTTTISSSGNLITNGATSTTEFSGIGAFSVARFGATATSSFASNGALTLATALTVANGGTGATSFTSGSLVYGSGTGALQSVATTTATIGGSLSYTGTFGALVGGSSGTLSLNMGNANTWTALQQFGSASTTVASAYNAFFVGRTSTTTIRGDNQASTLPYASTTAITATTASTTNLVISGLNSGLLRVNASGVVSLATLGTDYQNFAYPFGLTGNATSSLTQFNGGLTAYASSTIGAGAQATGLTISGGATTTGYLKVLGTATSSFAGPLAITSSGTSTFANGIQISAGCFRDVNGNCIGNQDLSAYVDGAGSGSTNRVAYWSDSNTLTSDADFSFDGTTVTARDLLVSHTAPVFSINDTGSTGTDFRIDVTTGSATFNADISGAITDEFFAWATNNDEKMRLSEEGNLGIGTLTPSAPVYVQKNGYDHVLDGSLMAIGVFADSVQNKGIMLGYDDNEALGVIAAHSDGSSNGLAFMTSNGGWGERMRLTAAGSLGIGTTTPYAKLSVTDDGSGGPILALANSSNDPIFTFGDTGLIVNNNGTQFTFNDSQFRVLGTGEMSFDPTVGDFYMTGVQNTLTFDGDNTSGYAFEINNFLRVAADGNGTTTLSGLNINGSATSTSNVGFNLTAGCYAINGVCISAGGSSFAYPFTSGTNFGATTQSTTTNMSLFGGLNASSTVRFGNAGQPMFLFNGTNGRLGLGTSTPGAMLSIAGDTIGNKFTGAYFVATSSIASQFLYASTTAITATTASTTNLVISALQNGLLKVNASGVVSLAVAGTDYATFAYPFPSNATSTTLRFNNGLLSTASSTFTANTYFPSGVWGADGSVNIGQTSGSNLFSVRNNGMSSYPIVAYTSSGSGYGAFTDFSGSMGLLLADSAGATQVQIHPSGMSYFNGGNVGINVTNPSERLEVEGNINIRDGYLTFQNQGYGLFGLSTPSLLFYNDSIRFTKNGKDLMRVTDTGNVGMGTSTPWAKLSIHGNANDSSISTTLFAIASSTNAATTTLFSISNTGSTTAANGFNITAGCYAINGTCITGGGSSLTGTQGQVAYFSGTNTAIGTSSLFIAPSGRVGIGTTTAPWFSTTTKLFIDLGEISTEGSNYQRGIEIYNDAPYIQYGFGAGDSDNIGGAFVIEHNGFDGGPTYAPALNVVTLGSSQAIISTSGNFLGKAGGLESVTTFGFINDTDTGLFSDAAGTLGLSTDGIARLRIDSAGNVGIGTTTPNHQLTIASTTGPQLALSAGAGIVQWTQRNAGGNLYFSTTTIAGTATTTSPAFMINGTSGYVGIGTSSPMSTFTVSGANASQTIADMSSDNVSAAFNMIAGATSPVMLRTTLVRSGLGDAAVFGMVSNHSLWMSTNNAARMAITAGGYIGVGTTSPLHQFTIASSTGPQLALSAGQGITQWTQRNAGGNLYFSTTTNGVATTTIAALEISGSGFGTTTLRGLNINGQATSTSNVGFNITAGCYAVNGTCVSGGGAGDGVGNWFTGTTNFNAVASATTTPIWFQSGANLFASSTVRFGNAGVSEFFYNSSIGNLGLGTTTPFATLQIATTTGKNLVLSDSGAGTNLKHWLFSSRGGNLYIGTTTDLYASSTIAVLTLNTSGNLGIGTTTPYARLSVAGAAAASYFNADSSTATSTFAGGLDVGGGALKYDYSAGLTSIQNLALGAITFDTDGGILSWVDMPVTSSATVGTVESYSAQIDGTPILTVYSESDGIGGIKATSTKIGIGTTTPFAKLAIQASGAQTAPLFEIASTSSATKFLSVSGTGFGTTTLSGLTISGSATSTSNVGFNITSGCFAVNGTCISGGSSGANDFTFATNFGSTINAATTSILWAQNGINASSTSQFAYANFYGILNFATTTNATSTLASYQGLPFITASSSAFSTGVGRLNMSAQVGGGFNSAFGDGALQNATSTSNNTAIGYGALASPIKIGVSGGSNNTAIGLSALGGATSGTGNVALGSGAGATGSSGSYNILIGNSAQLSPALTGSNNILIGGNSSTGLTLPSASASDQLNIQNIIYGVGNAGTGATLSTGMIGIGTTSPSVGRLTVASTTGPQLSLSAGAGVAQWTMRNAGGNLYFASTTVAGTATTTLPAFLINGSTGRVGIGTTTPYSKLTVRSDVSAATSSALTMFVASFVNGSNSTTGHGVGIVAGSNSTAAAAMMAFYRPDGTQIGGIRQSSATAVQYNTTSDRRIKENLATSTIGLADLMRIPVLDFNYISDPTHARVTGFMAQDLYKVFPDAVGTNGDNGLTALASNATPWGVDYGRVTPLIVKAIQDLNNFVFGGRTATSSIATSTLSQVAAATSSPLEARVQGMAFMLDSIATSTATTSTATGEKTFLGRMFDRIAQWFADAANGIGEFFAGRVHTKEICVGEKGNETCLTKQQLDALLAGAAASQGGGGGSAPAPQPQPQPELEGEAATSTPSTGGGSSGGAESEPEATPETEVGTGGEAETPTEEPVVEPDTASSETPPVPVSSGSDSGEDAS